jgi:hypothetical protein
MNSSEPFAYKVATEEPFSGVPISGSYDPVKQIFVHHKSGSIELPSSGEVVPIFASNQTTGYVTRRTYETSRNPYTRDTYYTPDTKSDPCSGSESGICT